MIGLRYVQNSFGLNITLSLFSTSARIQDLDEAVLDRVDEVVQLPKPELAERARLIRQYFSAYLHHDPPTDFLRASAAGQAAAEAGRGVGVAARGIHVDDSTDVALNISDRRDHDDGSMLEVCATTGDVLAPANAGKASSPQPELEAGANVRPPAGKYGEKNRMSRRRVGCGGGGGVVRMSEGFRKNMAVRMAMLAVRSEGFYGRDMAHFFSAVQVRHRIK